MNATHWMEYGEPIGDDRVEATHRVTYETGPNEQRDDDVTKGTLPMEALEVWEESEHVHDDESLLLSHVDDETREFLESAFETKPVAEIVKADVSETRDWEFNADVRVRNHNPDGDDVIALWTFEARPKHDGLVHSEDHVHETTKFWWPDAYPSQGDSAFYDSFTDWEPSADLDDDEALLEECKEVATFDPVAELDMLKTVSERTRERLTKDAEGDR